MPNQPQGGMFSRYAGEQVSQFPPGYAEAMASTGNAYASIGHSIAQGMQQYQANEQNKKNAALKANENEIAQRKADAAERANDIKAGQADTEATYKAYSAALASQGEQFKMLETGVRTVSGLIASHKDTIENPKTTEQEKELSRKALLELTPQHKASMERLSKFTNQEPVTLEQFSANKQRARDAQNKVIRNPDGSPSILNKPETLNKAGIGIPHSYYQSPAYNPNALTGQQQTPTKTVAMDVGGSAKKVILEGGRVSSVISANGNVKRITSNIPEEMLPAVGELADTLANEQQVEEAPLSTEDISIELNGPLDKKFRHTEPMKAIETATTKDIPVNGTIIWNETKDSGNNVIRRTPQIVFNSKSQYNADGTENVEGVRHLRNLSMIQEVLEEGSYKLVTPTEQERNSARDLFGVPENAFDLPTLAKAWAVVKRNTDPNFQGFDSTANNFGLKFKDTYGMFPSMFLINGESVDDRMLIPDATVALESTATKRLASRFESIGNAPEKPEGLQESINSTDKKLKDLTEEIEKTTKYLANPTIKGTDYEASLKNRQAGLSRELTAVNTQIHSNQLLMSNYEIEAKQYEARRNAPKQELEVDKLNQDLETGRINQNEAVRKLREGWIGTEPEHLKMYNGYVASALKKIKKTIPIPLVNKDGEPIMEKNPKTGVMAQKVYIDRLDAPETMYHLLKNRMYGLITQLSTGFPSEKELDDDAVGVKGAQSRYKDSLQPLHELNNLNNKFIEMEGKGSLGGELKMNWEKMFSFDPTLVTGTTYQKTLIGKIREAIVGPGNPSNYEQEVIASIVPNPQDLLTRPLRQQARVRALAVVAIMNHHTRMTANKLEITPEAMQMYNDQLSDILGEKITPALFQGMASDFKESQKSYRNSETIGNENKSISRNYGKRLVDILEARAEMQSEGKQSK